MQIPHSSRPWRFSVAVLVPFIAVVGLCCLALVIVLSRAAREADDIAAGRQTEHVRQAIEAQIAQVPHDQESVTIWDDTVRKAREGDAAWIHENLGEWMHSYFGHDQSYLFDPAGRVVHAMRGGVAVPDPGRAEIPDSVAALASAAVRPDAEEAHIAHHHVLDAYAGPSGQRHAGTTHLTELQGIDGRPAIVSVSLIVPHSDAESLAEGEQFVHASVQFINGPFLTGLADRLLLRDARFVRQAPPAGTPGSMPLTTSAGEPVGALVWSPERPGSQIVRAALPSILPILAILVILAIALLRRLYVAAVALEASQAQARHIAFHDPLTGLPNRHLLEDRLDAAVASASRGTREGVLLLLNLDRFDDVNDTYGHQAGNELIEELGRRLSGLVGEGDTLARLGGDEFALLLVELSGCRDLDVLCERVQAIVAAPFAVSGGRVQITASIGAVLVAAPVDRSELLRRADMALHEAKQGGRNCYRTFHPEMDEHVRRRHYIEQELRKALETGDGLEVHYQPKVLSATGAVAGFEALARWRHAVLGSVPPSVFVPVAEERGLVGLLDAWVLQRASMAARDWGGVSLAVNVSPHAFRAPGVSGRILQVLAQTGFAPHRLEVEITETVLVEVSEETLVELRTLRGAGVRIALDDFGTGYSSLNHLSSLEVDRIKIDKSFVQSLGQTADSTAIVSAVVKLGHSIGVAVTAEGVETESQRDFLCAIGCDEMQGFLFAPPMPASQVPEMLAPKPRSAVA